MIVALFVLLLDIVDTIFIANGHDLSAASEGVYDPNYPRPGGDPANVIERILAPHGALRLGELRDGHLQNGWKQDAWLPRVGWDLCARLSILMKEMCQVLTSMCHQVVQVLKRIRPWKYRERFWENDLRDSNDPCDPLAFPSNRRHSCVWSPRCRSSCCGRQPHPWDSIAYS